MKILDAIKKLNAAEKKDGESLLEDENKIDLDELKGAKDQDLKDAYMKALLTVDEADEDEIPEELATFFNKLREEQKAAKEPAGKKEEKPTAKKVDKGKDKKVEKKEDKEPAKKTEKPVVKKAEKKGLGIGKYIQDILKTKIETKRTNEDILKDVLKKFPKAKTNLSNISWYRNDLKKQS